MLWPSVRLGLARLQPRAVSMLRMSSNARSKIKSGPALRDFLMQQNSGTKRGVRVTPDNAYLEKEQLMAPGRKVYFDIHGCQMNVNDAEVVWAILHEYGYEKTDNKKEADIWLLVTCSIREGAETKIWNKLNNIKAMKMSRTYRPTLKVGLLGCMAERLKDKLLSPTNPYVDVVAGPDAYKDLPRLFAIASSSNESTINVLLSLEETYADVVPMRLSSEAVTGFVSIQRGPIKSILNEVHTLAEQGVKEVTLLGQNVNSYRDVSEESLALFNSSLTHTSPTNNSSGFKTVYKPKLGGLRFADLLDKVSEVNPEVRIRFVSPHPKDFPDEVLQVIQDRHNVCNSVHLPAQSGSSKVLSDMRRGYTREAYLDLVDHIRSRIPGVTLTSDFIGGFCGETDSEFEETLSLIRLVKYHKAFVFPYSLREKTHAHRHLVDDVPDHVKATRHQLLCTVFREEAAKLNREFIGTQQIVLIERDSKRSSAQFQGRTDGNVKVIFDKATSAGEFRPGDYVIVDIAEAGSEVIKGCIVSGTSLSDFNVKKLNSAAEAVTGA